MSKYAIGTNIKGLSDIGKLSQAEFADLLLDLSDAIPKEKADIDNLQKQALSKDDSSRELEQKQILAGIESELVRRKVQNRRSDRVDSDTTIENLPTLDDFEQDLYIAVRDQVQKMLQNTETWGALNKRYSGTPILKKGQTLLKKDDYDVIPHIQVYLDKSDSFNAHDIQQELATLASIQEFVDRGEITIEVYYFANIISKDEKAYLGGGTAALRPIIKNIQDTGPTNVIIMTDGDLTKYNYRPEKPIEVEGLVWYIWKDERSLELSKLIKGQQGTLQYKFK